MLSWSTFSVFWKVVTPTISQELLIFLLQNIIKNVLTFLQMNLLSTLLLRNTLD